jgi:hypothetical protein
MGNVEFSGFDMKKAGLDPKQIQARMDANWKNELQGKTCPHGDPLAEADCLEGRAMRQKALNAAIAKSKI